MLPKNIIWSQGWKRYSSIIRYYLKLTHICRNYLALLFASHTCSDIQFKTKSNIDQHSQ